MNENKVSKGWRTTAIVFIILFLLTISYIAWGTSLYLKDIKLNDKCAIEVCGYSVSKGDFNGEYDAYNYDDYYGVCSCFVGNEIVKEVFMK